MKPSWYVHIHVIKTNKLSFVVHLGSNSAKEGGTNIHFTDHILFLYLEFDFRLNFQFMVIGITSFAFRQKVLQMPCRHGQSMPFQESRKATRERGTFGDRCIVFSHGDVTRLIGPPYWITVHGLYPFLPCKLAKLRN